MADVVMDAALTAPNTEYLEFTYVGSTGTGKGKNENFIMENMHDGNIRITQGRIGVRVGRDKPHSYTRPFEEWEEIYTQQLQRGYIVTKKQKMEKKKVVKNDGYREIDDNEIKNIVLFLMGTANQAVEQNYSISVDDISDEMIQLGRDVIADLHSNMDKLSPAAFNAKLHKLWQAIPRRIDNISKAEVQRSKDFKSKIEEEQEMLDFIVDQIRSSKTVADISKNPTVLEANGLKWERVDEDEVKLIKDMMGPNRTMFLRAWRVTNLRTAEAFGKYCRDHGELTLDNGGVTRLFHGSRTENFWSISVNGLWVNPTGVPITGKAFGHGIYFAPSCQKSFGYTSGLNSYWAKGNSDTAYMAIFKVATGNIYDYYADSRAGNYHRPPDNWSELQKYKPGADCLWAYGGQATALDQCRVRNDEVIIYREDECTIEYLIELKSGYGF